MHTNIHIHIWIALSKHEWFSECNCLQEFRFQICQTGGSWRALVAQRINVFSKGELDFCDIQSCIKINCRLTLCNGNQMLKKTKNYQGKIWRSSCVATTFLPQSSEQLVTAWNLHTFIPFLFIASLFWVHSLENVSALITLWLQKLTNSKENVKLNHINVLWWIVPTLILRLKHFGINTFIDSWVLCKLDIHLA